MEKYQIFAISAALFALANNWHFISSNSLVPMSSDYLAYGFLIFGIYKLIKGENRK